MYWDGSGGYPGSNINNTCAANKCKTLDDGNCLCKTKVIESVVFTYIDNVSKNDVLSQLFIATIGPQADSVQLTGDGFNAHVIGNNFDEHTVFEVVVKGRAMFLKNVRSTVIIEGWERIPEILEAEDAIVSSAVSSGMSSF